MNIIEVVYNLALDLVGAINLVWDWLSTPLTLGFKFPLIGYVGFPPFTPISAFGVGIVVIIGLWAIKELVPLG